MYDGVSKGAKDPVVDQLVDKTTEALEAIADRLWVLWASHLIPNMACRVREATEQKVCKENDCKIREEAVHLVQEKVSKVAKQDKRVAEKPTALLVGHMMQEAFEENSEAEQSTEGEESEVVGMEDAGATGGTQSLVMEVDEEKEEKVVVVEEVK